MKGERRGATALVRLMSRWRSQPRVALVCPGRTVLSAWTSADFIREARLTGTRATLRTRARHHPSARARLHEPGDRQEALHLRPHGRYASRAHHAQAAARSRAELVMFALANGVIGP